MKAYYETSKPTTADIGGTTITIEKGVELVYVPDAGAASGYAIKSGEYLIAKGVWGHDTKTLYAYVPKDSVFAVSLARAPLTAKSDDWKETAHKWICGLNGVEFEYYTGSALKDPPKCDDVLHALINDASAEGEGFSDWCSNLGYDTDSRKALQTYLDCQEIAQKLRKAKIDIRYERERLQDY